MRRDVSCSLLSHLNLIFTWEVNARLFLDNWVYPCVSHPTITNIQFYRLELRVIVNVFVEKVCACQEECDMNLPLSHRRDDFLKRREMRCAVRYILLMDGKEIQYVCVF